MSRRKGGCRPQCAHSPALEAGKTARQVRVLATRSSLVVYLLDEGPYESRARFAQTKVVAGGPAPWRQAEGAQLQRVQCLCSCLFSCVHAPTTCFAGGRFCPGHCV